MYFNNQLTLTCTNANINIEPVNEHQLEIMLKKLKDSKHSINELCFLLNSKTELPIFLRLEALRTPANQPDYSWSLFTFKPMYRATGLIEINSDYIAKNATVFRSDQLAKLILGYTSEHNIITTCVGYDFDGDLDRLLEPLSGNNFESFFNTLGMYNFVDKVEEVSKKIQRLTL